MIAALYRKSSVIKHKIGLAGAAFSDRDFDAPAKNSLIEFEIVPFPFFYFLVCAPSTLILISFFLYLLNLGAERLKKSVLSDDFLPPDRLCTKIRCLRKPAL